MVVMARNNLVMKNETVKLFVAVGLMLAVASMLAFKTSPKGASFQIQDATDPSNPANVHSPDVANTNSSYLPVLRAASLEWRDKHPTKLIVNHGRGWYYFPYQGRDL